MFYCHLRPELRPLGLRGRRAYIPLQRKKKKKRENTKQNEKKLDMKK